MAPLTTSAVVRRERAGLASLGDDGEEVHRVVLDFPTVGVWLT
jgi:hypothetical protein